MKVAACIDYVFFLKFDYFFQVQEKASKFADLYFEKVKVRKLHFLPPLYDLFRNFVQIGVRTKIFLFVFLIC